MKTLEKKLKSKFTRLSPSLNRPPQTWKVGKVPWVVPVWLGSVSDVFGGVDEICAVFLGTEIDLLLQFIGLL